MDWDEGNEINGKKVGEMNAGRLHINWHSS